MLSDAKPELEQEICDALRKALYEAQMIFFQESDNATANSAMKKHMIELSMKFSDKAATEAAPKIANAIYDFVKSIGITAVPKTLVSPSGPVTGSINITDFKIN